MQCTDTGTLRVMSKSLQEYKFTSEGMTRGCSGLLKSDQHYKVRVTVAEGAFAICGGITC